MFLARRTPYLRRHPTRFPNTARTALSTLILAPLAACAQEQPSITVEVEAARSELLRGAPKTELQVTLTRTGGATGDVALALTGLPAEVTAAFSPAVLSGDILTSTLTLSATAAANEDRHTLDLTATGPSLTANASLEIEVVGLTVTGTVMGSSTGPLAGAAVASQDDTAITDAYGRFTLRGLSVPYDITAWSAADKWLHVFEGLTESEVTLATSTSIVPTWAHGTTVSGTLTGAAIPVEADQVVMVCLEGLDHQMPFCDPVTAGESAFSLSPTWNGNTTRQVRLHLLHIEYDAGGMPVAYPGYTSLELELKDGVPLVFTDPVDLGEQLETTTVELEIDVGEPISLTLAVVQVGQELALRVMAQASDVTSHDVLMPVIPGASFNFAALSSVDALGWTAGVTGAEATVEVPERPAITAPAHNATGVTLATDFTADNPVGGTSTWLWSGTGFNLGLTTTASSVNLPDPSGHGFSIPPGANVTVELANVAGSAETGARALSDFYGTLMLYLVGASSGYAAEGSIGRANFHSVTMAP